MLAIKPAPIAYVCFNRPQTVRITLQALCDAHLAKESDLHIFIDAPRHEADAHGVNEVLALCTHPYVQQSFASITIHQPPTNIGVCEAHRTALRTICSLAESFIFLEDDVLFSPHALVWFNWGLTAYKDIPTVFAVSGWRPPAMHLPADFPWDGFFVPRCNIWGFASWASRIHTVDWEAKDAFAFEQNPYLVRAFNKGGADLSPMLASTIRAPILGWDIVLDFARFKQNGVCLTPCSAYAMNIGTQISSVGSAAVNVEGQEIAHAPEQPVLPSFIFVDTEIQKEFADGMVAMCQQA